MKIYVAALSTETNTFAMAPTGLGAYHIDRNSKTPTGPWKELVDRLSGPEQHDVILGLFAEAQPDGPTVREVYEQLRDELLDGLQKAMPVDAVILPLHGAMVADGYPDCEGDIIERVRAIVGPKVPIGVELDLHCHYTERMAKNADIIIAYKEYPHTDVMDRFEELWKLTLDTARGRIKPVTRHFDCRMVSFWHTTREPMKTFVQRMKSF